MRISSPAGKFICFVQNTVGFRLRGTLRGVQNTVGCKRPSAVRHVAELERLFSVALRKFRLLVKTKKFCLYYCQKINHKGDFPPWLLVKHLLIMPPSAFQMNRSCGDM